MKLKWMIPIAAMALLVAACGDDDGAVLGQAPTSTAAGGSATTTAAAPTTTAAAGGLENTALTQEAIDGMVQAGISRDAAECYVNAVMSEFGLAELMAMEDGSDVSPETAFRMLELFDECGIDFEGLAGIGPDGEVPGDYTEMASPRSEVDGAYDYGDDADLDAFWDACAAGSGEACDELYFGSAFGSLYEAFGFTCGNRMELAFDCSSLGG